MLMKEIKANIVRLDESDFDELLKWMTEYHHQQWDRQIADDLDSGKFDELIDELRAEYAEGQARPI